MNKKDYQWVKRAVRKDKKTRYPALLQVVQLGQRVVASDGFRLHICEGEYPEAQTPDTYPEIDCHIPTTHTTKIIISTYHLIRACKVAIAFKCDPPLLRITIKEISLIIEYSSKDGTGSVVITKDNEWADHKEGNKLYTVDYQKEGEDITIGVNPKYILDALRGIGDIVEIWFNGPSSAILIKNHDDKQAIIMPMHLPRRQGAT